MATLADVSALEGLYPIFVFILVWAVIYGILSSTKVFGQNKNIDAIIGLVIAIIVAITPKMGEVFRTMLPWYAWLLVVIMVIIMSMKFFGVTDDMFKSFLSDNRTVQTWIIIISIIILIAALGKVYFSPDADNADRHVEVDLETGVTTSGNVDEVGEGAFWATLFNKKVLGFIMIMMIGVFTVLNLSNPPKK